MGVNTLCDATGIWLNFWKATDWRMTMISSKLRISYYHLYKNANESCVGWKWGLFQGYAWDFFIVSSL